MKLIIDKDLQLYTYTDEEYTNVKDLLCKILDAMNNAPPMTVRQIEDTLARAYTRLLMDLMSNEDCTGDVEETVQQRLLMFKQNVLGHLFSEGYPVKFSLPKKLSIVPTEE